MATESETRASRWRRGAARTDWTADEQVYAALLNTLSRDLAEAEATQIEMDADPRRGMADVLKNEQRLLQEQRSAARGELAAFREALRDARARGGTDGLAEVPYDSALPEEDARADLLIQYLVRPGYAEVHTEELESTHRIYFPRIDWDRLYSLAREQGHALAL